MTKEIATLSARISKEVKMRLDIASVRHGISQEKMIEKLLLFGLEEIEKQQEKK